MSHASIKPRHIRRCIVREEKTGHPITGASRHAIVMNLLIRLELHPSMKRKVDECYGILVKQGVVVAEDSVVRVLTLTEQAERRIAAEEQAKHERRMRSRAQSKRTTHRTPPPVDIGGFLAEHRWLQLSRESTLRGLRRQSGAEAVGS